MPELLALITIIAWPLIPLFWIPVHLFPALFKKMRLFTYVLPICTWLPTAFLLYQNRSFILKHRIDFPDMLIVAGVALLVGGTLLHIWTGKLLSLRGLIGMPEVVETLEGSVIKRGAFSVVRHPTYLAHTLMFVGVFLYSGVFSVGVVALLDLIVVNALIIPLEEKELCRRFGDAYLTYQETVPRIIPKITLGRRNRKK